MKREFADKRKERERQKRLFIDRIFYHTLSVKATKRAMRKAIENAILDRLDTYLNSGVLYE